MVFENVLAICYKILIQKLNGLAKLVKALRAKYRYNKRFLNIWQKFKKINA